VLSEGKCGHRNVLSNKKKELEVTKKLRSYETKLRSYEKGYEKVTKKVMTRLQSRLRKTKVTKVRDANATYRYNLL